MKGSPAKMGGIKGASGHVSALKQQAEASALKAGTDWWDKVKAAGGALYDNVGKVHGHGTSNSFSSNVAKSYGKKKKEYRKEAKESSNKMKSPMEQKEDIMVMATRPGSRTVQKGKKTKVYSKEKGDVGSRRNITKTVVNEKTGKTKERKISEARAGRQIEKAKKRAAKGKGSVSSPLE